MKTGFVLLALVLLGTSGYAFWSGQRVSALQRRLEAVEQQLATPPVQTALPPMAEFRLQHVEGRLEAVEHTIDPGQFRDAVNARLQPVRDYPGW